MNASESTTFYDRVSEEIQKELARSPGNTSMEQILQGVFQALRRIYTDVSIENQTHSKNSLSPVQDLNETGARVMQMWGQLLHSYLSEAYQALEENASEQLEAAYQIISQEVIKTLNQLHKQATQILNKEKRK